MPAALCKLPLELRSGLLVCPWALECLPQQRACPTAAPGPAPRRARTARRLAPHAPHAPSLPCHAPIASCCCDCSNAGIIDKAKELGVHEFEDKQKQAIGQVGAACAYVFLLLVVAGGARGSARLRHAAV